MFMLRCHEDSYVYVTLSRGQLCLCYAVTRTDNVLPLADKETSSVSIFILSMYLLGFPISYVIDVIYVTFSFYS